MLLVAVTLLFLGGSLLRAKRAPLDARTLLREGATSIAFAVVLVVVGIVKDALLPAAIAAGILGALGIGEIVASFRARGRSGRMPV